VLDELLGGCAILDREGLTTAFGHLSVRTGDDVIISGNCGPGLVSGSQDVLTLDRAAAVLDGDAALLPGETAIHLRILAQRRDVASVCRFHGPACLAFSTLGRPLPATIGMGLFLGAEVPWFDTSTTVTTAEHGDRLAAALGSAPAVLLRGFGAVTVGRSIRESVARAWLLERSAAATLAAGATGQPLGYEAEAAAPFLSGDGPAARQTERLWNYLLREDKR
jgi:ribulose-5-phosphate 4-epimerase/fuculose-1-phosphate aldolase